MSNDARTDLIRKRLQDSLYPSYLEVIDDSAQHIGHAGAQGGAGHFTVVISSPAFKDQTPVACHRLIYQAVTDLIPHEIHALRIVIQENHTQ